MHPGKEISIQACSVSSGAVDMAYPEMGAVSRDDAVSLGAARVDSLRALPYLARWWKKCADSIVKPEFVWVVDEDAVFVGNSSEFFSRYDNETADIVSAALRQQEGDWWGRKYFARWGVLGDGFRNFTNGTGAPVDVSEPFVARYSSRALGMIVAALEKGAVGPEEAYAPTLCRKSYGFGFMSTCKTLDFASKFASPHYRAEPAYAMESVSANTTPPHCSMAWRKRWIHPVAPLQMQQRANSWGCLNSTMMRRFKLNSKFFNSRWKRMRGRVDNFTRYAKRHKGKRYLDGAKTV
jgi:hypothetical protein